MYPGCAVGIRMVSITLYLLCGFVAMYCGDKYAATHKNHHARRIIALSIDGAGLVALLYGVSLLNS